MQITSLNPATEQVIKTYNTMTESEVADVIRASSEAYAIWRRTPIKSRKQKMLILAELLLSRKESYAQLITAEMGKPIRPARAEIEKCAMACQYFAKQAEEFLAPQIIATEMKSSYVAHEPLGSIFGIMPWNFPFWQVFRSSIPSLMAGNAMLLKHAPNVTGCGLAIEQLFLDADFPQDLFKILIITEDQASDVIAHPAIQGVMLTGSQRAGRAVSAQAGKYLKRTVLELGGSDPYLILADANIAKAAELCVKSRLANSGQVCIAAKRLIVVKEIKDKFQQEVLKCIEKYRIGNPLDEKTDLGPLAREDLREKLQQQVELSMEKGAKLFCGGAIPLGTGFFYPITVLDEVKKGMPAYDEELFGPVITFITAKDIKDAVSIANDTPYGLAAAIFTQDEKLGQELAEKHIEAGSCYVNQLVSSDPRLPFGGIKTSGYGRELSKIGMDEFVNIKTIAVG